MSQPNTPSPSEELGDLGAQIDEIVSQDTAEPETHAESPEPKSPEQTLSGLDEMLSEAAERGGQTLSPLDEPDDEISSFDDLIDIDEELDEPPAKEQADTPQPDTEQSADESVESALEIARDIEDSIHGTPVEEKLYDDEADDPDETDAPQVYAPDEGFTDTEKAEAAKTKLGKPEQSPEESTKTTGSAAQETGSQLDPEPAHPTPKAGPSIAARLAPLFAIAQPAKGISLKLAGGLSSPLTRVPTNHRDLISWAVGLLLFNILCAIAVLLF